jgi:hypothetical protein
MLKRADDGRGLGSYGRVHARGGDFGKLLKLCSRGGRLEARVRCSLRLAAITGVESNSRELGF